MMRDGCRSRSVFLLSFFYVYASLGARPTFCFLSGPSVVLGAKLAIIIIYYFIGRRGVFVVHAILAAGPARFLVGADFHVFRGVEILCTHACCAFLERSSSLCSMYVSIGQSGELLQCSSRLIVVQVGVYTYL